MIVLNILFLSLIGSQVSSEDLLKSQFPLYGLSEVAAIRSVELKSVCNSQLKTLYYALKKHETWALRMLDSSGSPANGFVWGNNYWLGTYSHCRWLSSKKPTQTSAASAQARLGFPPFGVGFYVSLFKQNTSLQTQFHGGSEDVIHLGLCLPSVCSVEDLGPLLSSWAEQTPLAAQNLFNFTMEFQKIRAVRPNFSWVYNPLTITLIIVIAAAILLTISGTIYDIYVWTPIKKRRAVEKQSKINKKPAGGMKKRNIQESSDLLNQDNNLNECYELKIDNSQHKSIPVHIVKTAETTCVEDSKQTFFARLLLAFSATSNIKIIFETPQKPDELSIIYGLRFLGMIWLIWLYSALYLNYHADNELLAPRLSESFSEHLKNNSTFSLDTIFFTSGFMLAVKYYKHRRGSLKTDYNFSVKKKVNEFSLMALTRFMSLTPVYIVVLAVFIISVKNIRQTSVFEVKEPDDEVCQKYWWRNIAYINNLFSRNEMCMSWSWYLSTDMQFFLLGLFIMIISTRFWKFASFATVSLVILSSLITGYFTYGIRYTPKLKSHVALLHILHYSPWTRIGPYLIGMLTGYFVVRLKGELMIKRTTLITCWLIASICKIWALFGLYTKNLSTISTALHTALSRTAWGIGLSWIVIACCTGHAGVIKAILSYPKWTPLSRLSYSAYLLSPLIINLIVSHAETALHLDIFQMVVYFFGHLSVTYLCAFFLSLIMTHPFKALGRQVIAQKQIPNQLNQSQ